MILSSKKMSSPKKLAEIMTVPYNIPLLGLICLILLPCCTAIDRRIQDRGGSGGNIDNDKNEGSGGSVAAGWRWQASGSRVAVIARQWQ